MKDVLRVFEGRRDLDVDLLAIAIGVYLSSIKSLDAILPSSLHDVFDTLTLDSAAVGQPSSQRESRDLESGSTQIVELHVLGIEGSTWRHLEILFGVDQALSRRMFAFGIED